ncbi:MAG: GIY-YIG nuclease family protein [Rubellimicrobium sp.]|nr:GIY-YIG nuclease family protein [Rubellimicrobium sp.]
MREPAVYIMASRPWGTIYTGVTSDLPRRVWQHRTAAIPGFTARYDCKNLVWFERHDAMETAILREKQIKGCSRRKKLHLIEAKNPFWHDLWPEIAR